MLRQFRRQLQQLCLRRRTVWAYPHRPQFCPQVFLLTMQVLCLRLCAIRFLWTFPQGRSFRAFLGSCVSSVQTKFGGHFRQSVDVRKLKIARKGQLEKCGQLGFAEDIVREQEKRPSKASEFRAEANRRRNPSPASKRQEDQKVWSSGIQKTKTRCWSRARTRFGLGGLAFGKKDPRVAKYQTCKRRNRRK